MAMTIHVAMNWNTNNSICFEFQFQGDTQGKYKHIHDLGLVHIIAKLTQQYYPNPCAEQCAVYDIVKCMLLCCECHFAEVYQYPSLCRYNYS